MRKNIFPALSITTVVAMLFVAAPDGVRAAGAPALALSGRVSSQEEGRMEGVLVSAKREGSTITTTVVSDAQGRYGFPAAKLEPRKYALRIRAAGYELADARPAQVAAEKLRSSTSSSRRRRISPPSSPTASGSSACPERTNKSRIFSAA